MSGLADASKFPGQGNIKDVDLRGPIERKYDEFYKKLPEKGLAREAALRQISIGGPQREGMTNLVNHSQSNLDNDKAYYHTDDSGNVVGTSTIYTTVMHDERLNGGAPTVLPTVWDGEILKEHNSIIDRAVDSGKKWPAVSVASKYKDKPWEDKEALDSAVALSKHAHALVSRQKKRKKK
jgi:hypothetical protein